MPSQILHTLFGEDLLAGLRDRLSPRAGKALERIQNASPAAFALGCQGPDIFYHSQGRRPVALEYGTLLHRRGAGGFAAALLGAGLPGPGEAGGGENTLGAYALGFMTHPFLDRAAHPYIVSRSSPCSGEAPGGDAFFRAFPRGQGAHPFFERILDVLMLEGLRGLPVSSWEGDAALAEICRNPPPGLRELLARTLAEVFPERAGKDLKLSARMDNALADCAGFYFFTDPLRSLSGLEKSALRSKALLYRYPRRILREIDCLNLARGPWPHPASGREERRSFPEIYRDAAEAAAAALAPVFGAYLETGVFPPGEASRAIGNGGLSVTDEEGKPRAPRRAAPLPLHEILELHEF